MDAKRIDTTSVDSSLSAWHHESMTNTKTTKPSLNNIIRKAAKLGFKPESIDVMPMTVWIRWSNGEVRAYDRGHYSYRG